MVALRPAAYRLSWGRFGIPNAASLSFFRSAAILARVPAYPVLGTPYSTNVHIRRLSGILKSPRSPHAILAIQAPPRDCERIELSKYRNVRLYYLNGPTSSLRSPGK